MPAENRKGRRHPAAIEPERSNEPVKSSFVLEDELEDLTYDFTKYTPNAVGVIPEPTLDQIKAFQKSIREALRPVVETLTPADEETTSQEQLLAALAEPTPKDEKVATEREKKLCEAMAAVCSGHPTYEEISSLPYRGQQAFAGWLVGVMLNPNR